MSTASYEFDGADGRIHVTTWSGAEAPRFVTLLAHGYGEHAGRYEHVAAMLVGLGAVVYAPDHLGHGQSSGERALVDDIEVLVTDLHIVADRARTDHPGLPVVLVGHSMGGLIAARFAQRYLAELTALVLSGPVVGGNPAFACCSRWTRSPTSRSIRRSCRATRRSEPPTPPTRSCTTDRSTRRRCRRWRLGRASWPPAARSAICRRCGSTAPPTSSCPTT